MKLIQKVKSLVLFFTLSLSLFTAFSKSSPRNIDSLEAEKFVALAIEQTKLDSSIFFYKKAYSLYKKANLFALCTGATIRIAKVYFNKYRNPLLASDFIDSSIEVIHLEYSESEYKRLFMMLGFYRNAAGKTLEARDAFEKAKELYEAENDIKTISLFLNTLANIYSRIGEFDKARNLLNQAIEIYLDLGNKKYALRAINNLGTSYRLAGKGEKAMEIFRRGLSFKGLNKSSEAILLASIAELYFLEDKFEESKSYNIKAIKNLESLIKNPQNNHLIQTLISSYTNLGSIYDKLDDLILANKYFDLALQLSEEYYQTENHREVAKIHDTFGNVYFARCDFDLAFSHFQKSFQSIIEDYHPKDLDQYPNPSSYYPENAIMLTLKDKANAHLSKYKEEKNIQDLHLALQGYLGSLTIADTLRSLYRYESSSLQLLKENTELIEKTLLVLYELFAQTKDEKYAEQAFQITEKNKAILLQESAQKAEAEQGANIPTYFLKQQKEIQGEIDELNWARFREEEKGTEAIDSTIQQLKMEAFDLKEMYDSISIVIEETYPEYQRLKSALPEVTVAKVRKKLKGKHTSLIEYFVGKEDIYILAISENETQFRQIHIADTAFEAELLSFLKILPDGSKFKDESIAEQTRQTYIDHATSLYDLLLAPVMNQKELGEKLIIIPDGMMGYLPFDILLKSKPEADRFYNSFDYVLNDYIIRNENSAAFFLNNSKGKRKTLTQFGGYAPSYKDNWMAMAKDSVRGFDELRKGFGALKNTQKEVANIQAILGGDSYFSFKATEQSFRQTASQYQILHLAMHAFTNDVDPLYSGLIFTQTQDGTREEMIPAMGQPSSDNFLLAYEIYNLRLQADLAVLSACRTGLGKLEKGEGVMNLARAFRYAGCPNVLMSLWDADDYATRIIMESFYANLKLGLGKDEALHKAKLNFIMNANPDKLPPSYWATFILIGDDEPIYPADLIWEKGLYGFLILLLLFLGISWYRRRGIQS